MVQMKEILDYPSFKTPKISATLLMKRQFTPNSFQYAMKVPLVLLQIFGFFPVKGVTGSNYRNVKFKWLSWRVACSVLCLTGYSFHFVCYCARRKIDKMLALNALFFHFEGVFLSAYFLYLAFIWPKFVKQWHLVEMTMRNYDVLTNVKRKILVITAALLSLALVEHTMVTAYFIARGVEQYPDSLYNAIRYYFQNYLFVEVFHYLPFSIWLGLLLKLFDLQKTFIWTFIDIFIISVSICFNYRLQQISKKLIYLSKTEVSDENIWRTIREHYVKLSRLCELINRELSWLIIISFLSNIYHLLSQLFSSLKPIESTFHKIYFCVSFFLLILRGTTVCIFGGAIYDQYEKIIRIVTTVPSAAYNVEVERFIMQLGTCETALTGKNFFKITKNLILKVTSAIVTYELVLIQFNQQEFRTKDS